MTCEQNKKEESYVFFEDIGNYIKKADLAESTDELSNDESECNSFIESSRYDFKDKTTAKSICEQFKKLYVSLPELKCNPNSDPNYKKSSEFLNYWVNFKLREILQNEDDSVCDVYNYLENRITVGTCNYLLLKFIYDINKDDFYKMNILYRLYKNYTVLDTILENEGDIVNRTLLSHSTACCTDYLVANYMCNDGNDDDSNNSPFCTQLRNFKTKYDLLYNRVIEKNPEYTKYFKKLSECKKTNTMSTALIGTTVGLVPLLVGIYKVK
ncbi:hypothetical protein PVBG_05980 [Plasmodium vivax Brazil I]|uniref:PIR Superfamily Protein n=1 Tax=Plasmodium vivax (strain Brazil I) TaxID=1033975 RepID=A0A0J9T2Q9_PLAV1|nr:hypothetical protein PVBG_05980 [Plasmodium vivax Brazil I]